MSRKIHIAASPITNTIYAGHVLKDGMTWGSNQQDVTIEALTAVIDHALRHKERKGGNVVISKMDGTPEFEIVVNDLRGGE
jgi:hypothetical protein